MSKKASKIALGLGLLTGAVTGLLFAPDEGKNIRKKIAKGDTKALLKDLEMMGEEMKGLVSEVASQPSVKEALEKAKDRAADVANLRRSELDALLDSATEKAESFKKKVAAFVKEQKALLSEHAPQKNKAQKAAKKVLNAGLKKVKKIEKKNEKKQVVKKTKTAKNRK